MHVAFASTNPCHIYDLVYALSQQGTKVDFYSGYPAWRLSKPLPVYPSRILAKSFHTLITYSLLRLPEALRPHQDSLFSWQDKHFDKAVAKSLETADFLHGLPGQCLHTFRRAKELGIPCVLNHASGPVKLQMDKVARECKLLDIPYNPPSRFNEEYFTRESEEYRLADFHTVASSIVAEQLESYGINKSKIFTIPYGANPEIFTKRTHTPDGPFKILFAGVQNIRKGVPHLLNALELSKNSNWECHFFGHSSAETSDHIKNYQGKPKLVFHGAVSQSVLAKAMANSSLLILPSVEEAFGLVVAQALQVGLPTLVSSNTGAKDLITHRDTGSIFEHDSTEEIYAELLWWSENRKTIEGGYTWEKPANTFLELHKKVFPAYDRTKN